MEISFNDGLNVILFKDISLLLYDFDKIIQTMSYLFDEYYFNVFEIDYSKRLLSFQIYSKSVFKEDDFKVFVCEFFKVLNRLMCD